jgi:hypothetical protein
MKKIFVSIIMLTVLTWYGCRKDFIVEDINKKTITVNAPANDLATTNNLITFWWEPVDGAEKYTLQIVEPDFSKVASLVLDTNVTVTKFNFSLEPGVYQWRIKATNAGHSTAFQTFNLNIDTTSNLSALTVNLISPVNGAITGNTVVTFNWSNIAAAKKYRIQINDGVLKDTTIYKNSFTYSLQAVKNATTAFTWNVKAINDESESPFNPVTFKFTVDLKGPAAPGLVSPNNDFNIKNNDTIKWTHAGDAVYDSIYIAEDTLFVNMLHQVRVNGNSIPVLEFNLPYNTAGTYYWWRIRSFDAYGNPSSFSLRRKFKLVP